MSEPCTTCGGTGFTVRESEGGVSLAVRCACSVRDRADRILRAARIPRRYEHCALDNFEVWRPQLAPALAWARNGSSAGPSTSTSGCCSWAAGNRQDASRGRADPRAGGAEGAKIVFAEQRELLKDLQSTFDGGTGRTESDVLAPILEAEVLLLDDLGAGRTTAWAQDVMHDVLAHRYNRKLPTVMTTNRATGDDDEAASASPDAPTLRDRLGDALMSRLYEMCRVIPVAGEDFRRRVLHARHRF
jgi:DNA replication protein DnaC